ncbi:hypothetical protein [Texcoconibacillus texcoconensis]|uniref:DUF4368 domain-containing protein n=1 Tax=Texcoconibacillus texcoconensis TaxID=1095777 RepID=A0A840QGZ0_9BACI|nr:hypothetical protein [Texcoconibacillus texcoconensis]MBB5171922.1 hypothetical protein [Texcoconibacillus texcoconensis]
MAIFLMEFIRNKTLTYKLSIFHHIDLLFPRYIKRSTLKRVDLFVEVADESQNKINELNVKKSELKATLQVNDFSEEIEKVKKVLHRFFPFEEVTNEMLHYLVERIDVKKDGTPIIKYRHSILFN